ncbi:HAD family hydrolase [Halioxenophilus aromaticivorans]|uniref:HAD-IA family hydrolase n=1 Tax=Halioxenophilus aromaticivorans TaxID=1306992 RepID=A0AAV3UA63_9ALTE
MLFVFDWDGTLCDSLAKIVRSLQTAAAMAGESPLPAARAQQIIGLALPVAVERLFPCAGDHQQARIADYYRQAFAAESTPAPLFAGVEETLLELRARGHRLAVATGKARFGLDRSLAAVGLENFFCTTRCADETASKPNPQMLHEIMCELGFAAEDSVMVGDTTFDLEMASAASMPSLAVTFGSHGREELQECRPLRLLDSIPELLHWESGK